MQDAAAGTLDPAKGTLTLVGVNADTTYFADRPSRTAGRTTTRNFVDRWTKLFGTDPPNAGLQAVDTAGLQQPKVLALLGPPTLVGGQLVFKVKADTLARESGQQSLKDVSLFIDGGDPAGLVPGAAAPAAGTAQHTVTVVNHSANVENIVIYQAVPPTTPFGVQSLAWLTAMSWPQSTATFTWSENRSFVWGPGGQLFPGVIFQAIQSLPADPGNPALSSVILEGGAGSLQLRPVSAGYVSGSTLTVADESSSGAVIGVAMNGSPAFAASAQPFMTTTFPAGPPQYFIAAGSYQQGEVLYPQAVANPQALSFTPGNGSLDVGLEADGSWTVSPG